MPNTKNLEQKPTPSPEKSPTVSVDLPIEIHNEMPSSSYFHLIFSRLQTHQNTLALA
jgi:hypothetical protein